MRISLSTFFILFIVTALIGCKATGPADDGWETSEGFKEGDGLFSKEKGGYKFSVGGKNERDREEESEQKPSKTSQDDTIKYNTQAPTDYQTYLRWREAKDNNSDEYRRFQKWQEFEDYLRWKESR